MLNLDFNNQNFFALDLGGSAIKILQLQNSRDGVEIKAFSEHPIPLGLFTNDTISDPKALVFLLEETLRKPQFGKITTQHMVACLPESKSFVRVIQIPEMSDSEAENAVPVEAESFIPMPIDQVYLDWQKIGVREGKMDILIIASPKDLVDKYLSIFDQVGIKPIALEVESQSCHRAVVPKDSKETLLIVDLDARRSSLIMVEDGHIQFTSTVPIAGDNFTESIARYLGVSTVKAEEIKRKVGIANTADYPNIKTSLIPTLKTLVEEIKNILNFHRNNSDKQVSRILLVGGGARLKNLPEFLVPELVDYGQIKVELGNPWVNVPKVLNLGDFNNSAYTTAIGQCLRGIV
jgi:type IV pilus assembly protein PilM